MSNQPENEDLHNIVAEQEEQDKDILFGKSESELLGILLKVNNIPTLVMTGMLTVSPNNVLLGFFKDVVNVHGHRLKYPDGQNIDDIFIYNPNGLEVGGWYFFECELAGIEVRREKNNPYHLRTTLKKVKQGERLNPIAKAISEKKIELDEIEKKIKYEENEAKIKLKGFNKIIAEKLEEVSNSENLILDLSESIETAKVQLSVIEQRKTEMENTIESLKGRVSLCRNLGFLSEQDENQYLTLLQGKKINIENHLDFDNDFGSNFSKLAEHIHQYLYHKKNLLYTRFQIKNFLTLLRSHDIVVLSGLSGSGKTQIVKAFAEALGGVAKIIPIKPNWTSSDDLIGYYNPIQMSFLPTPFTEAIVEAIQNPHQLYFICLDEMNLARVEYYFADFLSKLEERSKEPEIELYAKHEEELFVSEFNTLLDVIESSIGEVEIKSWQDFLNNKEARTRFFEMLGSTDKESLIQLHSKMKRRLIDILKFPATIKIPNNIRFIGAINVDETTHYFSPKILDRVHIVKFENPLLYEEEVIEFFRKNEYREVLNPVYMKPDRFSIREEYPKMNESDYATVSLILKDINQQFLLPLNIDFGVRSIRQSLNYAMYNKNVFEFSSYGDASQNPIEVTVYPFKDIEAQDYLDSMDASFISLNTLLVQKVFPRFLFDGNEISKSGISKMDVLKRMQVHLNDVFKHIYADFQTNEFEIGKLSGNVLSELLEQAENNSQHQINFFA